VAIVPCAAGPRFGVCAAFGRDFKGRRYRHRPSGVSSPKANAAVTARCLASRYCYGRGVVDWPAAGCDAANRR